MKSEENKTNNKATIDLAKILNKIRESKFAHLADDQFFSSLFEEYKKEDILKEYSQLCSEARKNFREFLNKNKDIDFLDIRNPNVFTSNSIKDFLTSAPNLCDRFGANILLSFVCDQIIFAPKTWNLNLKSSLFSQLFPYLKKEDDFKRYIIEIIKNKDILRIAYENQLLTQELIVDTLKDIKDRMDKEEFKRLVEESIKLFSPGSKNYFDFYILLFKKGFNAFEFPIENIFKNSLLVQMVTDKFYDPLDYIENEPLLELLKNSTIKILNGFSKISEPTQKKLVTLIKNEKINLSGVTDADSIKAILRKDASLYDRFDSGILQTLFKEDEDFLLEMIKAKSDVGKLFEENLNEILKMFLKMKPETQKKLVEWIAENKNVKLSDVSDKNIIKAILVINTSLFERLELKTLQEIDRNDNQFFKDLPEIIENVRQKETISINKETNEKSSITETNILDESIGPELWEKNYGQFDNTKKAQNNTEQQQITSTKNDRQKNITSNIKEDYFTDKSGKKDTQPNESTISNGEQFLKNLTETIQNVTKKRLTKSFKCAVLSEKDLESSKNENKSCGKNRVYTTENGIYFYEPNLNLTSSKIETHIASQNEAESQEQNKNENNTFSFSTKK